MSSDWKIKLHGYGGAGGGQGGIMGLCLSIYLKTREIHDQKVISSSSSVFFLSWCSVSRLARVALHRWLSSVLCGRDTAGLTSTPLSPCISRSRTRTSGATKRRDLLWLHSYSFMLLLMGRKSKRHLENAFRGPFLLCRF